MNREDWVTCEFEERCEGFTKNTMRNGLKHFRFAFALLSYNIRYKFVFEIIVSATHNRTAISLLQSTLLWSGISDPSKSRTRNHWSFK